MMDNLPDSQYHALLVKIYETWELYLCIGGVFGISHYAVVRRLVRVLRGSVGCAVLWFVAFGFVGGGGGCIYHTSPCEGWVEYGKAR